MRGTMKYDRTKLRDVMTEQGRRNDWLASQTEYSVETIARYMSGQYEISDKFAERAARALGIPVAFLRSDEPAETAAAS